MGHPGFDALPDGVVVADHEGTVVVANAVARSMLGSDDLVGRPVREVLTLVDQDGRDWFTANHPYAGLGIQTGVPEQSWLLPSGQEVLVNARIHRPTPTAPVEQLAIGLRSGRGRARLDRERSDLVATVAHELRSPLTGVKGFVQALLNRWEQLSDDQKKLMLTTVSADADRLARLIAELLDVARIDTGRLSLFPRPVDAVVLIGRAVASVQAATSRTVTFVHDVAELDVSADPDKFTQVVTNLVENGVRHGDGEVRVTLTELPPDSDHPGAAIVVEDEGEGIPEALRQRVLTKFWKHGVSAGSGLGMYIASGLAKAHGGSLTIDDRPGGGARITVHWPSSDRRPE